MGLQLYKALGSPVCSGYSSQDARFSCPPIGNTVVSPIEGARLIQSVSQCRATSSSHLVLDESEGVERWK